MPSPRWGSGAARRLAPLFGALWLVAAADAASGADMPLVVSTPGPGATAALPIAVAARIGADRAEGLALQIRYTAGGAVALDELLSGDADVGVFALPTAVMGHLTDPRTVAIAVTADAAPWALVVRAGLDDAVRHVGDLRGRAIGTHTDSPTIKTTSRLVAELVLSAHGIGPDAVRFVPVGQSWPTIAAALRGRAVDAAMIDPLFAARLEIAGIGFPLAHATGMPADDLPDRTLRGVAAVRRDRMLATPEKAERFVRMLRRALGWLHAQSPATVAATLGLAGEERAALELVLARYPAQFSIDGAFSAAQLAETERFVRLASSDPRVVGLSIESVVLDRWVGRKP